jgi:serine/threonine-protein kinase
MLGNSNLNENRTYCPVMINLKQHYKTLVTAATPLPLVIHKPALLKIWLFRRSRERLILLTGLLILLLFAGPISQSLVDLWYPLDQDSFKTNVQEFFNSPILRKLEKLRDTRYWQVLLVFWSLGLSAAVIVLILDLPRTIREGERKGSEDNGLPAELAKTRAISRTPKKVRYVGANQRYRIDKAIASGGGGIVYQAHDTVLGRQVALKELLEDLASDAEQAERFKVEARALALLNHPCIMPVYDLLEENGRFWLVMELLTGGSLGDLIEKDGIQDVNQSVDIIKGIASGLGFAHQHGFIHRDIKPANILFADDGTFRVTDFGIAKHQDARVKTSHGLILGSPGYMSPEQAAGEDVDPRSDIYSLGITMYQMLTAELPFQGDTSAVMAQHITKTAPRPSAINRSISKALDGVILKMLAKRPEDRFQSTAELIDALNILNRCSLG